MLSMLTIKNILLIKSVELEFKLGLNTVTGETGVGKSILLDCLGFVLGWNNSSMLIREGAQAGEVTAEFNLNSNSKVSTVLEDAGIFLGDTLIIRRIINRIDGRKRNFINDKVVSLDLIKRLARNLVELQDQNGNQLLQNEQAHIQFLDRFAGLGPDLIELKKIWKEKLLLEKKLESELLRSESIKSQIEYLEFSTQEISSCDIQLNEEENLELRRRQVKGIERNKEKFKEIDKLMSLAGFEDNMVKAIKLLDSARQNIGEMVDAPIFALDRTLNEFSQARLEISKLFESQNFEINELEKIEDRLFLLKSLSRKYNVNVGELPALCNEMLDKLNNFDVSQKKFLQLRSNLDQSLESFKTKAKAISKKRLQASENLDRQVMQELQHLKMAGCLFQTEIVSTKASSRGLDNVVFKVVTNRGGKLDKLQAISSGGEVSRFLLALKVCLTDQEQGITLIFDEIDRGIGGATADSVGRRLAILSKHSQVIVVTHSPQVAAHGNHQWKVEKKELDNNPTTDIKELNSEDRLTEIARMLSGKEISVEAVAAAKKLLG